jgi:endonuclease/exonuclease/phosphatase family metal-dependent hydrolase
MTKHSKTILSIPFWMLAAVMISWYVLHNTRGDSLWPVRMLSYLTPWLTLAALAGGVLGWRIQHFKLAVVLSCLFLLFASPYLPQFVPNSATPVYGQQLKVMTYSVMGRNQDYPAMAKVYAEHRPDLAFFQEVGAGALEELLRKADPKNELYFLRTDNVGFVVCRYPLKVADQARPFSRLILTLPDGEISLWNVHTDKAIRSYDLQFRQVKKLVEAIWQQPGPKIVAGDFNATEGSEVYRLMNTELHNAFAKAGFGFGFTFPTPARRIGKLFPFLRIDHIFTSEHFVATSCEIGKNAGGSDHFPVVVDLVFRR